MSDLMEFGYRYVSLSTVCKNKNKLNLVKQHQFKTTKSILHTELSRYDYDFQNLQFFLSLIAA